MQPAAGPASPRVSVSVGPYSKAVAPALFDGRLQTPPAPPVHDGRRRETSAAFVFLGPKPKPAAGFAGGRGWGRSLGANPVHNQLGLEGCRGRRFWAGVSESLAEIWAGVIGWLSLEWRGHAWLFGPVDLTKSPT